MILQPEKRVHVAVFGRPLRVEDLRSGSWQISPKTDSELAARRNHDDFAHEFTFQCIGRADNVLERPLS
jgi:hypothetical protein